MLKTTNMPIKRGTSASKEAESLELKILKQEEIVANKFNSSTNSFTKVAEVMESFKTFIDTEKNRLTDELREKEIELKAKKLNLENEKKKIIEEYNTNLEAAKISHADNISKLNSSLEEKKEEYEKEVESLKRAHEQDIYELELSLLKRKDSVTQKNETLIKDHWDTLVVNVLAEKGKEIISSSELRSKEEELLTLKNDKTEFYHKYKKEMEIKFENDKLAEELSGKNEEMKKTLKLISDNERLELNNGQLEEKVKFLEQELALSRAEIQKQRVSAEKIVESISRPNTVEKS